MVSQQCPLCASSRFNALQKFRKIGLTENSCRIVSCNTCGHFFSEINKNLNIKHLYNEGQYKIIDTRNTVFDRIMSFDDFSILRNILRLNPSGKTLLDFGCGKGRFLHNATKYGWKVKGIETAKKRAEFGKKFYGLDINTYEYNKGEINGSPFDVITMFHVLEHLSNPKAILTEIIKYNLQKNGLIVIEVPLFDSLQAKIAGKRWIHLDPPYHISHFTKRRLVQMIDELQLKILNCSFLSLHLGILGMAQSLMSLFGYRKMLITELKFNRNKLLFLSLLLALPLSVPLELTANYFKSGGVIRVYCKRI